MTCNLIVCILCGFLYFLLCVQFLGIDGKEVVIEDSADAELFLRGNGIVVENLVYVISAAGELTGKPHHGFSLVSQLLADK